MTLEHHNACPIEVPKSLSLGPCAVKTLVFKKKMSSNIEITHFVEMPKSLSLGPCRGKTLAAQHTSAKRSIGVSHD